MQASRELGLKGLAKLVWPYVWPRGEPGLRARVLVALLFLIAAKQAKNEMRSWPDWRASSPDVAIEHDRRVSD